MEKLEISLQPNLNENDFYEVLTENEITDEYEDVRKNLYDAYLTGKLNLIVLQGQIPINQSLMWDLVCFVCVGGGGSGGELNWTMTCRGNNYITKC